MSFRHKTKRFLAPIARNKLSYGRASFIYLLRSFWSVLNIYFLKEIVKIISAEQPAQYQTYLIIYCISFLIYAVITFLLRNYGRSEVMFYTTNQIYPDVLKRFVQLDNTTIEKTGTGKLVSIIEKGIITWNFMIHSLLRNFFSIIVSFVFVNILISHMGRLYLLGFYAILIGFSILASYHNHKALRNKELIFELKHNFTKQLVKIIMSKKEVMGANKINKEITILDNITTGVLHQNQKRGTSLRFLHEVPKYVINLIRIAVFFVVGIGIYHHHYNIALLVGIISALALLDNVMENGLLFYKNFTESFILVEKLREFLDHTDAMDIYKGKHFLYQNGDIEVSNISFAYGHNKIFDNFSLRIQGGAKTAFVGESGGGKTTLIKLLAGYIKPDKGSIFIDQQSLPSSNKKQTNESVSLQSYYHHIGYLTQDPSVFDGTVYENLTYALDYTPTADAIDNVIELAKCEFIYELAEKLETEIGERGVRLSGGQKQRLAIAKIMLKNPSIILLDEPTSALDSFNEEQITTALHNLFQDKTVIVVAHRLQTVKQADRILFIEKGKIIEEGTHAELIKQNGKYKKMLDLQSGF